MAEFQASIQADVAREPATIHRIAAPYVEAYKHIA
jgi:hypothetical protein